MLKKIATTVGTALIVASVTGGIKFCVSMSAAVARIEAKQDAMDHRIERIERTVVDTRLGANEAVFDTRLGMNDE